MKTKVHLYRVVGAYCGTHVKDKTKITEYPFDCDCVRCLKGYMRDLKKLLERVEK